MSVNSQILNIINDIEKLNEETTTLNNNVHTINDNVQTLEDTKQNNITVLDTIQISKLKTQYITMNLTGQDLQSTLTILGNDISSNDEDISSLSSSVVSIETTLDTKQDNIISTTDLTCNSITVLKTTPIENDELTSKMYVDNSLAEKQDNVVSSTDLTCNSITVLKTTPIENDELTSKMYLDNGLAEKQDNVVSSTDLTCNSITVLKQHQLKMMN
jgi:hypothetical protein